MTRLKKSEKSLHSGHRERLRRRFLEDGLDSFEDHQLLEFLLFHVIPRRDTNPVAHRLMKRFGSFSAVLEADPKDVTGVEGVGDKAAAFLSMLPQVTRRYFHDRVARDRPKLTAFEAVAGYLIPLMAGRVEEVFYVLCLDSQGRVIYPALVGKGTVKDAAVHSRHVVEVAARHRAVSVLLAHNHPGGEARPSRQDRDLTRLLVQALGPLDIHVPDHFIIEGNQVFSFAREGVMPVYDAC